ncbi:MAG: class I SAM-dependent methyltransferase [Myxococcales bacterium]|nr:class I SAM-dependent methyltransferase [Myxococcales bacterium]
MWDQRYAENDSAYGVEPNDFLMQVADKISIGSVLCLAEGQGRNSVYLASLGHKVKAMDQSELGLAQASQLATDRGLSIETEVADLAHFEFYPSMYDGIVSIWAHVPPKIRQRVHTGCVEALKPGGIFILEAYTPAQVGRGTGGPPDPTLCMQADELKDELAGLSFEILVEREREIVEGSYHSGTSSVVQVLARKP